MKRILSKKYLLLTSLLAAGLFILVYAALGPIGTTRDLGAWDLQFDEEPLPIEERGLGIPESDPARFTIVGSVRDEDGRPVERALVAFVAGDAPHAEAVARTDAMGRFTAQVRSGTFGVTVTSATLTAVYEEPRLFGPGLYEAIDVLMENDVDIVVRGHVHDEQGRPIPGTMIELPRVGPEDADIFYVETDRAGRFRVRLPHAEEYHAATSDPTLRLDSHQFPGDRDTEIDLLAHRLNPAGDDVVESIRSHAVPLTTVLAEHGFTDLEPLRDIVGDARVVALGEATHGTREFFQLKHRLVEFLVEEMGFRVFAIEASWPDCQAVNDYVLHGRGTAARAVANMRFWTWDTEEVWEMVEWMRRYNLDPSHQEEVQFLGFDMQFIETPVTHLMAYLPSVDEEAADRFGDLFLSYARGGSALTDQPEASKDSLDALLQRIDERREMYESRSSAKEWRIARQEVVLLQQFTRMYQEGVYTPRDEAMAENVMWIMEDHPPDTRVVLWAHNGHIQRTSEPGWTTMGSRLAKDLGSRYVTLGFSFDHGGFQAVDHGGGPSSRRGLRAFSVGPAPPENVEHAFARVGESIFVLDLRSLAPDDPARRWLDVPRPLREIGNGFFDETSMSRQYRLTERFDAIVFVAETTSARSL